jgi:hypothetical protein
MADAASAVERPHAGRSYASRLDPHPVAAVPRPGSAAGRRALLPDVPPTTGAHDFELHTYGPAPFAPARIRVPGRARAGVVPRRRKGTPPGATAPSRTGDPKVGLAAGAGATPVRGGDPCS